jgi:hypothetical protein
MQYLRCENCGATFYTARRGPIDERCAECGGELSAVEELHEPGSDEKPQPSDST